MSFKKLARESILYVGDVFAVEGRKILIKVDKNKNLSDIFYDGDILKNISVNSFIEIRKGYLSVIGKVEEERIKEEFILSDYDKIDKSKRFLTVTLIGYFNENSNFVGGIKELPLIGNEAFIVTERKSQLIYDLIGKKALSISIARSENDEFDVRLPIDGLFNSHIAVFGNTGSGKSNTLTSLYKDFLNVLSLRNREALKNNSKFVLFDFNGEYVSENCITSEKVVYDLSTRTESKKKIPMSVEDLLDLEIISVLSDASEKTQKPFLRRTLSFREKVVRDEKAIDYFRAILRKQVEKILKMGEKDKALLLLDYVREILPPLELAGKAEELDYDLAWNNVFSEFMLGKKYLRSEPATIKETSIYKHVDKYEFTENLLLSLTHFMYLQLIHDVLSNRAMNEHVSPVINKFRSKMKDIEKIFDTSGKGEFWGDNFVVINLNDVNTGMKKTIPLLISKKIYNEHKIQGKNKTLTIIIDEAHNILSHDSSRETEEWKSYRLETFEEIIKEGRKFGVFVTLSSQRPSDISSTITSQAHNYFIHRLINHKDLEMISKAVSYIDKITEESIPLLPTGTCIFSGVAGKMPIKINVKELPDIFKPQSKTLQFEDIIPLKKDEDDIFG